MQIYKFHNILKPVLWGGDKLLAFKHLPPCDEPIGESWELSALPGRESVVAGGDDAGLTLTQLVGRYGPDLVGREVSDRYGDRFPLLIKLIDARRDLSVQVHPDDAMARRLHGCDGKNEMWYVLHADDGAQIYTGFNRTLSPQELDERLSDGTLLDVVNAVKSKPGDTFYIPAGQIHSIGAGNLLVEIQHSSDITYRVWDYNRRDAQGNLRQLHVEQAREALDYGARQGLVQDRRRLAPGLTRLVDCSDFAVTLLELDGSYALPNPECHTFVALVCVQGDAVLEVAGMPAVTLRQGETALVPAIAARVDMSGSARMLLATVPIVHENFNS